MKTQNVSMSGLVLIDENQKLLFQKRTKQTKWNPNVWGFFGGKFEPNETKDQCLIREIFEEINLNLENKNFKYIGKYIYENTDVHFYYYFISNSEKQNLKLQEGQDWIWVDYITAIELDFGIVTKWNKEFLIQDVKPMIYKKN